MTEPAPHRRASVPAGWCRRHCRCAQSPRGPEGPRTEAALHHHALVPGCCCPAGQGPRHCPPSRPAPGPPRKRTAPAPHRSALSPAQAELAQLTQLGDEELLACLDRFELLPEGIEAHLKPALQCTQPFLEQVPAAAVLWRTAICQLPLHFSEPLLQLGGMGSLPHARRTRL
eukprot:CAMPEP_0175441334 /NCGR_PEP_ID=MMETSP0095-20121207/57540_1 /TAXON_ID=311494 /ORGANISM="Alexandrium monilatum, Strain CCMP3105" /LENGTH=171 /DNA_ID=CAMNT_0016741251 /DNA_START=79 /DNA_END=595 /DNA_ORIENTATION=+